MACHVYNPHYYEVITIVMCDMHSKDVEFQVLMWRALVKAMKVNGVNNLQFKGFIIDNA
jgi:hypothetical protein